MNVPLVLLVGAWLIWAIPFIRIKTKGNGGRTPQKLDKRARWGIVLEAIGFFIVTRAAAESPGPWRIVAASLFDVAACALVWFAVAALGKQWRVDAGLNQDHELVRSGPYRFLRHPIYTSMLCMLLGMGFLITPLPFLAAAVVIFMLGTEIRVRIEDSMLSSRFGTQFVEYKRSVPAYLPLIR